MQLPAQRYWQRLSILSSCLIKQRHYGYLGLDNLRIPPRALLYVAASDVPICHEGTAQWRALRNQHREHSIGVPPISRTAKDKPLRTPDLLIPPLTAAYRLQDNHPSAHRSHLSHIVLTACANGKNLPNISYLVLRIRVPSNENVAKSSYQPDTAGSLATR